MKYSTISHSPVGASENAYFSSAPKTPFPQATEESHSCIPLITEGDLTLVGKYTMQYTDDIELYT